MSRPHPLTPEELAASVAKHVESLRTSRHGWTQDRTSGKSIALLTYAKELLDEGNDVVVAYMDKHWLMNKWQGLFPDYTTAPLFISRYKELRSLSVSALHLLVDEPRWLRWTQEEWKEARYRFAVVACVGDV